MARKTLGYVEMEWVCPRCGSKNPGPQKTCTTCGGPQPKDVQFQQREGQELIKDEKDIKAASAGADVHCPYCGTRNTADAMVCVQCGADLKGAEKRESGGVVGAFSTTPSPDKPCPACGQMNPAGSLRCSNCGASLAEPEKPKPVIEPLPLTKSPKMSPIMMILGVVGIIALIIICIVVATSLGRTETVTGSVADSSWTTQLVIEKYQSVNRQGWENDIPAGAQVGACEYRFAYTASEPQPVSTEVCGTPYTVDQGSGFGQVMQDCVYETYAEYCDYTVETWVAIDTLQLQGSDLFPQLPQVNLGSNERAGESNAQFMILFNTDQGSLEYQTTDLDLYQKAAPGSTWSLEINRAGNVIDIQPAP